jgi:hypothetical protein
MRRNVQNIFVESRSSIIRLDRGILKKDTKTFPPIRDHKTEYPFYLLFGEDGVRGASSPCWVLAAIDWLHNAISGKDAEGPCDFMNPHCEPMPARLAVVGIVVDTIFTTTRSNNGEDGIG